MIKIFNNKIVKKFKLQKNKKIDESLKIHLKSVENIKKTFENNCIVGFYAIEKCDVDSSFFL